MESISQYLSGLLMVSEEMGFGQVLLAVLVTYLGGVLSSLTPCVYPMIPITVSIVGGTGSARKPWREVALRSAAYVGGMAVIYSFLGVIAGVSGKVFGSLTNTTGWYLVLGFVMTVAALAMLDVISLDVTHQWEGLVQRFSRKKSHPHHTKPAEMSWLGAFMLGASSGFIAAPCTTPVLTALLGFIAQRQSVGLGFILMMSFSMGFGTLLLMIALFAGALQILPRSGQWMKTVKILGGLILLAFAEYLIYRAGNLGGQ